jgi:hypothetical protein
MKTGDLIASVAQPIAKGMDAIFGTNIKNCGGCGRRREMLNQGQYADALYDIFWQQEPKPKEQLNAIRSK